MPTTRFAGPLASLVFLVLGFIATPVSAQEIPYDETGLGPFYDIQEPLLDAEIRDYAEQLWDPDFTGDYIIYPWIHHEAPEGTFADGTTAGSVRAPFIRGHSLMRYLYGHLIGDLHEDFDIEDIAARNPVIARTWEHWTKHQQLATHINADPLAHANHQLLISYALTGDSAVELRGVPVNTPDFLVSDRFYVLDEATVDAWFEALGLTISSDGGGPPPADSDPSETPNGDEEECQELQAFIDEVKGKLSGIGGLYKPDTPASDGPPPTEAKPGFDCDDFATALGHKIKNDAPDAVDQDELEVGAANVYYDKTDGSRGRHRVLHVDYKGWFWLIDPQSGQSTGPHADGDDRDAEDILPKDGYKIKTPPNMKTNQKPVDIDHRGRREPPPFHEDSDASDHFRDKYTGPDEDSFFPPGN